MSINWGCAKKFQFNKTIPENNKTLKVTMKRKQKQREGKLPRGNYTTIQLDSTEIDIDGVDYDLNCFTWNSISIQVDFNVYKKGI